MAIYQESTVYQGILHKEWVSFHISRIKISPILEIDQCPQTWNRIASSKDVQVRRSDKPGSSFSLFFTHSPSHKGSSEPNKKRGMTAVMLVGASKSFKGKGLTQSASYTTSARSDALWELPYWIRFENLKHPDALYIRTVQRYCCWHLTNVRGGFVFVGVDEVLCTVYGTFVWTENREYPALLCSVITLSLNGIVERQTIRRGRCIRILTGANMARLRDQQCSAKFGRRGKTFSAAKTGSRADRPLYQVYSVL